MTLAFPSRSASLNAAADKILKSDKLDWINVDIDTLPHDLRQLYDTYKAAQAIASEARTTFEDATCGPVAKLLKAQPGQDVAFGYRWGNLSVALTAKRIPTSKANALRF